MTARTETVTILFTDLVGSTELLQRAGDEQAQRIFKTHHRLLSEAVEAHGGNEVKWLGDGLMVAFDSAADAVKCAIVMQQMSRRPTAGERLEIRVGLNVGEAFLDESDYFGTSVVIARRLCDKGDAGQILASDIVVRLLEGRGGDVQTKDLGPLDLKGITNAVPSVEIMYDHDPMALLRKLPFVGRVAEYETMLKKFAEARNRRGSVILLAGEPGIGKTRLTEEFCEHAASGAVVIRGNCYEEGPAFGPWLEALRALIERLPEAELRAAIGEGGPDLVAMLPEAKRRLSDLEEGPRLDPESQRARLIESIIGLIRNAAEHRPLVLFFDDPHWCDRPSLMLLERVARSIVDRSIVIVGTYRDVEVDRMHPLAQTLAALRKLDHHERIVMHGLTESAVYDLLSAIESSEAGTPTRRALAIALYREAQGNPLFIREVFNSLVESGKLNLRENGWGSASSVEELGIPEGVKEVIGRRLSRLSEGCNRLLQRASALGTRFTWDELRAISAAADGAAATEDELLNELDEALQAQLLREDDSLTYAFTHALIAATLYDELSGPRRVLLHQRIANALEALYAADLDAHTSELARQFYEAVAGGDVEKAIAYSRRAAEQAIRHYAWEEAVRHYERALQLADLAPAFDDRVRIDLLLALADPILVEGGNEKERQEIGSRAVELARTIGDREAFGRAVLTWAGPHREDNVTNPHLIALLEEGLETIGSDDSAVRAKLLARLSAALFYIRNERERRAALMDEALAIGRRLEDRDALMYVLRLAAWLWDPGNAEAQVRNGREMLDLAREARDLAMSMEAYAVLVGPSLELGERDDADAAIAAYVEAQRQVRRPGWGSTWRAMQASFEGRLADAARFVRESYSELRDINPENANNTVGMQLWNLRRQQGRLAEQEAQTRQTAERYPEAPAFLAALSLANLAAGHLDEVRVTFATLAIDGFANFAFDRNWTSSMAYLADTCSVLGDRKQAAVLYGMMRPYQHLCVVTSQSCIGVDYVGSLHLRLANLAATMEQWSESERHYDAALAIESRMRAGAWLAHTQLEYGAMLIRRAQTGDIERALILLEQARSFAQEAGMERVRHESERLLATRA